jgi:DNA-directed RNA polymerase specialized sigma subunit
MIPSFQPKPKSTSSVLSLFNQEPPEPEKKKPDPYGWEPPELKMPQPPAQPQQPQQIAGKNIWKPLRGIQFNAALTAATLKDTRLEPEYHDVYMGWKNKPSPTTMGALIKRVNPIIDKGIISYAGGSKSPTIRSKAKEIVIDSMGDYDPRQARLQSYLLTQLQGLQRYKGQQINVISVPERVLLDRRRIEAAEADLRDSLGREPSDRELADHTGLSLKRIEYVRSYRPSSSEGAILENMSGEDGEPAEGPAVVYDDDAAWVEFVYHDLNEVDQTIMEYMLGLHGSPQLSVTEIANKLGITPGAVSQRTKKIQDLLDQREELEVGL